MKNDVVWEDSAESVEPHSTVKHPQKVHAWGAVSYYGTLDLYLFTETLDSDLLIKIFEARLPAAADMFPGGRWMLQQDNDPKHTSNKVVRWLEANVPSYIPKEHWPPLSPDANIIEAVWSTVQDRVYAREPRTLDKLKRVIREEWNNIKIEYLQNLVNSIPRRFAAIRTNDGGPTKY
jgi:hypothetical protein